MKARENSAVVYKFILYKIKKLVCDSRGKARYITNFDNVIYEIFGVEHFSKKLNNVYSNKDFVGVLDKVGVEYLLELTNNSKLYNILADLVEIDTRMLELRKEIRKSGKKNKRDKALIKEFNYLTQTYKEAIKLMRKRFGIKNSRTAYKRRYHAVNDLLNQADYDDDDEFTSILMRDDDFFFQDDDDDDYEFDDYESTSELDDFVRRMNGSTKSNSSRRIRSRDAYDDFDIDDDDDDFDNPPRRRYQSPDEYTQYNNDKLNEQVDTLADTVELLASSVQSIMNEREYSQTSRRSRIGNSSSVSSRVDDRNNESVERALESISAELSAMRNNNKVIAQALDNVLQRQDDLTGFLGEMINDMEEENDTTDVVFETPNVVDNGTPVNTSKYPDIYEMDSDQSINAGTPPSREELIDMINQSGNEQQKTVATVKQEIQIEETTVETESNP